MAKTIGIEVQDIELEAEPRLWDVMNAVLHAKEAQPGASLLPGMLIFKSGFVVAKIYQSREEPRTLRVLTSTGMRQVGINWHDTLSLLYRTTVLNLQKLEGASVIFLAE